MKDNIFVAKLIEINAIRLNPDNPFTWASGWLSPIYCDNRITLSFPEIRAEICRHFSDLISTHFPGVNSIAGVATGAIAHGVLVAHEMGLPFAYVRSSPKNHGLENLIEGKLHSHSKVVVVEDLISTGKSSLQAVEALRNAGCEVLGMVAIFTYGFEVAKQNFAKHNVPLHTLASYDDLIAQATEQKLITPHQHRTLLEWRKDPGNWKK
ncbi:MAG TPA: orotate phosphoribosyltransferase [Tenuifilaceae bacterium]|nr:orotate phosphoribosyltransferase [Tenuifilaceae bacterium]